MFGYRVILADPPWRFKTYSARGLAKSADNHYPTMTLDEIKALPVSKWAADDCALFLWATWPTIFQAQEVIDAWGFKYSGLAWEWIKFNPDTGKYAFGCGYGTRKNVEPCLLARRGKPKLKNKSVRDFMFERRRDHSQKPQAQYPLICSMYDGPYLEMFAHCQVTGWDSWGNETNKYAA